MSLFWKKMKALFLQTKICEVSQIKDQQESSLFGGEQTFVKG